MNRLIAVAFVVLSIGAISGDAQRVATPTFSIPVNKYFGTATVRITSITADAQIYYTTDESAPTTSAMKYAQPIVLTQTTTFKAQAYKTGLPDSGVIEVKYIILKKVATPVFSALPGKYSGAVEVKLTSATEGATIFYTTDGTKPTASSLKYANALKITVDTKLRAVALKEGLADSKFATAKYSVAPQAASPVATPAPGEFFASATVRLASSTFGAVIRYTLDGSEPTSASTLYAKEFLLTQTTSVKAKAFLDGSAESDTTVAEFKILTQAAPPAFSSKSGEYFGALTLTITSPTAGTSIRYTLDGSEPTAESLLYDKPFVVSEEKTVKAKALKAGLAESTASSVKYTFVKKVANPAISAASAVLNGGAARVRLTCATAGAAIRYTLDGSDPDETSTLYAAELTFTEDTKIKAKAFKEGLQDSAIVAAKYSFLQ